MGILCVGDLNNVDPIFHSTLVFEPMLLQMQGFFIDMTYVKSSEHWIASVKIMPV